MILPISLTAAAAATLLNIWIAFRVGKVRIIQKIGIGDGGHAPLTARMRAHGNFVEYMPFFLILLALVELARGSPTWLWLVVALFIAGRILHVFGMDRPPRNPLRMAGILITMAVLLGLAVYAAAIPYLARPSAPASSFA